MDEIEFESRALAYSQKLYRICYAILPERADCDDAIQEALIKAWRKRGTLRNPALFETWLTRITINECKNIIRQKKRMPIVEMHDNISFSHDVTPVLVLRSAIRGLDIKLRIPFVLHYIEGYTIQESAQILSLSYEKTKYRLAQAKAILKKQLMEEDHR